MGNQTKRDQFFKNDLYGELRVHKTVEYLQKKNCF